MADRYLNAHRSQYDAGCSPITRSSGCTWTSGANGVDASTGGKVRPTPDRVHALVSRIEETNPATPGWSMADLARAMRRLDVPFTNRSGTGFPAAVADLLEGHYIVLQGDSDRFGNSTCSGRFGGDHAIGVHPDHRTAPDGVREWWIDDPICATGRWEREDVLRAYAKKLYVNVYFGRFDDKVPPAVKPLNPEPGGKPSMAIRYAPRPSTGKVMRLAEGQYLYAAPGGARVTRMERAADVPYIGLAPGYKGKDWRAVWVSTGSTALYADGSQHGTVLCVPDGAGPITTEET